MRPIFVTSSSQPLMRWAAAFPNPLLKPNVAACLESVTAERIFFVDSAAFSEHESLAAVRALAAAGGRVIALTARPDDGEAFKMLSAGARGYCHAEAVPEQLIEVAGVVESGGYWMPPGLVQRLLSVAANADVATAQPPVDQFDALTQREYAVAVEVGKGLNNREIAESMGITERTVKAHLTAIFEKLGLRDRVQLALVVNRLPIH